MSFETVTIGSATLYRGDCMELLKQTPDKYYDLCICDPPYGIGADKEKYTPENETWKGKTKNGYLTKKWDDEIPTPEYFNQLKRVSKNQIIWGANYFGLVGGYIFWNKKETMPTYSKGELAWTSLFNRVEMFEMLWSGYKKEIQEVRCHPTQKPVKLYEWLLTNYAKPGDRILDTHGGSMSSVIACLNMGFEVTCCEMDADYFAAGVDRVRNAQRQQPMFDPVRTKQEQDKMFVDQA